METKFCQADAPPLQVQGHAVAGYASLFGLRDRGGDMVLPGAYGASLKRLAVRGDKVRMLWQHDPAQPIGVWDTVTEDARGLYVTGRLLPDVARARDAAVLLAAGALDGLSIGYRTLRAEKLPQGGRNLVEVELWEVSLVTFPMQLEARLDQKSDIAAQVARMRAKLQAARAAVARM